MPVFENLTFGIPKKQNAISKQLVKYDNAIKLANEINIEQNKSTFCIVSGNFIFGDFIEEFIIKHKFKVNRLIISSLSADQNNIDSLNTLLLIGAVKKLDLILSTYFYGFQKKNMMRYIDDVLDKEKTNLTICDTHCKMVLINTECGRYFVIHGSANLPSSNNIEHFEVVECKSFYKFNLEYQLNIIDKYKIVKKPIRTKELWQTVITKEKGEMSTIPKVKL